MKKKIRRRRTKESRRQIKTIYLLPNFFTTMNLFFGFYAVIHVFHGNIHKAVIAVILAVIFDGLDGRTARLTNSTSAFGVQYDSMADLVSFGVAPGLIAYSWSMESLGKWGWLAAFFYMATVAMRLARFNIQSSTVEKVNFQGLPSPAGAGLIISTVLLFRDLHLSIPQWFPLVFMIFVYLVGLTMISTIPFYSFKDMGLLRRKPFISMAVLLAFIILLVAEPAIFLFGLCYAYFLSGLFGRLVAAISGKTREAAETGREIETIEGR